VVSTAIVNAIGPATATTPALEPVANEVEDADGAANTNTSPALAEKFPLPSGNDPATVPNGINGPPNNAAIVVFAATVIATAGDPANVPELDVAAAVADDT
jgi:hypothetical protein